MSGRPDLATIRREYQAPDDEMIDYHPRVAGMVDIPFTKPVELTKTEGKLIDEMTWSRGLQGLTELASAHDTAFAVSKSRFPDNPVPAAIPQARAKEWQFNDGHRDAFRHTYWNALMTKEFGEEWTKALATAHEGGPGNPANREAMDLYNNQVGRTIATSHPNASKEELADLVDKALREGQLVVMDGKGQLAWSDQVSIGQHGLSPKETIQPHLKTPEVAPVEHRKSESSASHQAAIDPALTPSQPGHPRHDLYRQCSVGVDALDQQLGRQSDHSSACMKASLTTLAVANGFERVDHVQLSRESQHTRAGENVFIVQGDPTHPAHLRAHLPTEQAVNTPVDASFRELAQTEQRQQALQNTQALTQQQDAPVHGPRTLGV